MPATEIKPIRSKRDYEAIEFGMSKKARARRAG
jgi:hypothetical protein